MERKEERVEEAEEDGGRGRTCPVMERVMLGWVIWKGAVETDATGIAAFDEVVLVDSEGRDTWNGMRGVVNLKKSGAGLIMVALALMDSREEEEEDVTEKSCSVTRREMGGKCELRSGSGRPGMCGTEHDTVRTV